MSRRVAGPLEIRTFVAPGFGENAYLVRCGDAALAIDPGGDAAALIADLDRVGGVLQAVVLTHAHYDHVEGLSWLLERHRAPVLLHPADRPLYDAVPRQAKMFGLQAFRPPAVDGDLVPGEDLSLGACRFEVRHVPGHSPGHVILYCPEAAVAFVGDVVFQGSIGRTDLPGGDFRTLIASIRAQILTLPDETVLFPGHGPTTTVGAERRGNPFLVPDIEGGFA